MILRINMTCNITPLLTVMSFLIPLQLHYIWEFLGENTAVKGACFAHVGPQFYSLHYIEPQHRMYSISTRIVVDFSAFLDQAALYHSY